jgi:hypothetical protein
LGRLGNANDAGRHCLNWSMAGIGSGLEQSTARLCCLILLAPLCSTRCIFLCAATPILLPTGLYGRISVDVHHALNLVTTGPASENLSLVIEIVISIRAASR